MAFTQARAPKFTTQLAVPIIFGVTIIVVWECIVSWACEISPVLLPAPTQIAQTFAASTAILWEDFRADRAERRVVGIHPGLRVSAFLIAIAIDRFPFLQRGLAA